MMMIINTLVVPSCDASKCLTVGSVDRITMSGLVAMIMSGCDGADDMCSERASGAEKFILAAALKGKALRKHLVEGHMPCSDKCPWCVRVNLREERLLERLGTTRSILMGILWIVILVGNTSQI